MNTPVSFELAKLLKEKGYKDKNVLGTVRLSEPKYYDPNGMIHNIKDAFEEKDYKIEDCLNAPTIAEVVMWLYEKHGIWIYVDSHEYGKWCYNYKFNRPHELSIKITENGQFSLDDFDSPTEAYEAAIKYTLNNLLKSI